MGRLKRIILAFLLAIPFVVGNMYAGLSPTIHSTYQQPASEVLAADPLPPNPVPSCPTGRVYLESQSWWSDSRVPFPGAHIHLATCFPLHQVVTGNVTLNIRGILHGNPGTVNFLRVQVWQQGSNISGNLVQNIPGGWSCPTGECIRDFTMTINTSGLSAGRRELRLTLNIPKTPTGNRQFNTTRWPLYIRSTTGSNHTLIDRIGTAGWYTSSEYTQVWITAADALRLAKGPPLSGIFPLHVKGEDDFLEVSVDAKAHGNDPGLVLYDGAGNNTQRTVQLDTRLLADGQHRLFIRTDDPDTSPKGVNSGVFVIPFTVDN